MTGSVRPLSVEAPPPAAKRLLLANPRGFCAGVERAIDAVEGALVLHGAPIYVRRAIVHNRHVVERLERQGAVFVQETDEVPPGSLVILSAHGSSGAVRLAAERRGLRVIDAVCPLVAKVHAEVRNWQRSGRHVLLIGHDGHPEVVGTVGQVPAGAVSVVSRTEDFAALGLAPQVPVAYAVQTTFAAQEAESLIAAVKERFENVVGPRASDICYATTNRQMAVRAMAPHCDLMLVVGDEMSSNARRLVEVATSAGCPDAVLVASAEALPKARVGRAATIGLTAAASTPESAIAEVCEVLSRQGFMAEEVAGTRETVRFRPVPLHPVTGLEGDSNELPIAFRSRDSNGANAPRASL